MTTYTPPKIVYRPRRNRKSAAIRSIIQETRLHPSDFIYPVFVIEGENVAEPIRSMPGIYRFSLDCLLEEIDRVRCMGIRAISLFPVIPLEKKDREGSESANPDGLLPHAIREIKATFPEICLISDLALDPYTDHGHDGLIDEEGEVINDETLLALQRAALLQAEAGIDMIAPSDMMDGRVGVLRAALDGRGFTHVNIHAYCSKYASAFYAPFREAVCSRLHKTADKKTYQMNPANRREALLEATLDIQEGADILMIKPAMAYLDVIYALRQQTTLPLSAYQVSGEYAMITAAAANGWLDGERTMYECLLSIKRAGADMIFSYAAPQAALWATSGALD